MTNEPVVGILTRTDNRRPLLKRALESVLWQSYPHWRMVVVNDGGDRDDVDALIARYAAHARDRVRVVHYDPPVGVEAAAKAGLDALDTDLLVVHDHDSWAPEFLAVTTRELRRAQTPFPSVQGVVTYANLVIEQVRGNLVHVESTAPLNDWVPAGLLSLDSMLAPNVIPPISFLFSRRAFDAVGGIDEAIPYLGDWDFLVRFLCAYDVVVVPQYLAFHHRRSAPGLCVGVKPELVYRQMLLNRWLRADLATGRFGIGAYANLRAHLAPNAHGPREG